MTRKEGPNNVAASVRARLTNEARATGRPFNDLLLYYAIERFLFRLSQSRHAERFVLKGALLLRSHDIDAARPTRDIDLLGRSPNTPEQLEEIVRECLTIAVDDDGIRFDRATVRSNKITMDAEHQGVRVLFTGYLDRARAPMQIDVGFGDAVVPGPIWIEYPELLDFGKPRLLGYTLESAIAEKYQSMVTLGALNSRMKDFYDISYLASHFVFDGARLADAIRQTFTRRDTPIPAVAPTAFTPTFYSDPTKQRQWSAFNRRTKTDQAPPSLQYVATSIETFLMPPTLALVRGAPFCLQWSAGGPWKD